MDRLETNIYKLYFVKKTNLYSSMDRLETELKEKKHNIIY